MSNLRTEQPVFETDRITDGFDIFFWVFNDASSFVATHWHTAIEIMYIIDGEIDVMMNQQTVILKPGDVFLIDSRLPHSTKSVHGNHAVLIQLPYEFSKKYIPDVDSFIFGFDCHTDNAILRTKIDSLIDVIQKMRIGSQSCFFRFGLKKTQINKKTGAIGTRNRQAMQRRRNEVFIHRRNTEYYRL